MYSPLLITIREWLDSHGITYREVHHPPTPTSEDSARARGEPLRVGGKALLLKTDDQFRLFVLPADCKLDVKLAKSELGFRKSRFATAEELMALTGLSPGAVPPFGLPILPFDLLVDRRLTENDRIAFNAGSLTDSMILAMDDYLRIATPTTIDFSSPGGGP